MIKKLAKGAHYALVHIYAILGLLMLLYLIMDTIDYQVATFELLKMQTHALQFIAQKLTGMTS